MPEIDEQKKRIIEKALELIKRHGINYVTMDLIASELGLSKKTLYVHFSSKKDLLYESLTYHLELTRERHSQTIKSAPNVIEGTVLMVKQLINELGEFNPLMFDELKRYFPKIAKLMNESNNVEDYKRITALLEKGKSQGLIRDDIDIDIATKLFLLQMRHISNYDVFPVNDYPRSTLFKHLFINFLRGMVTKKGMAIMDKLDLPEDE